MTTIDLSPLYRNSIGFDRFGSLLDTALRVDRNVAGYPPYDIEVLDDERYAITLAVAGFEQSELDIQVEKGVLTVRGKKAHEKDERSYLYHGIAHRGFERKFNLADYVKVVDADLNNGLLTINLAKEIPEEMKPKSISIHQSDSVLEHREGEVKAA